MILDWAIVNDFRGRIIFRTHHDNAVMPTYKVGKLNYEYALAVHRMFSLIYATGTKGSAYEWYILE